MTAIFKPSLNKQSSIEARYCTVYPDDNVSCTFRLWMTVGHTESRDQAVSAGVTSLLAYVKVS